MTSPIRIGSGSIILVPDARQFRALANTELKKIELYKDVLVQPKLETGFKKNAQARLDRVRLNATAHIGSKLEDGFRAKARTEAQAALEGIHGQITARLQLDTAAATARMEAWRSRQQRPLRIRVMTIHEGGGAVGSRGGGEDLGASLLSGTINPAEVAKALQKLNKEISRNGGAQLPVTPKLNNNSTRQLQHDMDRMANSLKFQPRVGGLDLRLPLGGAFGLTMLPEMVTQVASLTAGIQQLAQAGLVLPGAFAAAGASLATVVVGISGMKEAYKALDTVQKDAATSGASQMAAQREMRDAVQDEVRARRDLSDAIVNEQRKQRDMALQLRGGKLAEAGAILELQESAEKLRTGRFANRLEYDKGVLEYEQNYQNLLEVRNKNADMATDVNKNEKTGVQNSDPVLNATEALTKATERMSDASTKLAQGSNALGTAGAKAQEALNNLAPSAQAFIKNLIALRPEFHRFAQGVQEDLTSGLTPAFNNMFHSTAIQTNMRGGMKMLAAGMNAQIKTIMADVSTPQMGNMFTRIFGATADSANRFNQSGLTPMINGLARLGAVGTEELPRIADALGLIMTRFNNFITAADKDGSLKHWMDQGLDAFTQIGRIVQNIFTAMSGVNRVFGGSFLKDVDTVTKRIADFLNSGRGQDDLEKMIVETRDAMAQWKPIIEDMAPLLKSAFEAGRDAVGTLLGPFELLVKAFSAAPGLIEGIATAFVAWKTISAVMQPVLAIAQGLQGHLANIANNLDGAGGKMGQVADKAGALSNKLGTFASVVGVGGPIVAAITTGIIFALESWNDKQKEVAQETQQLIQQQGEFAESLDRTSGMITQQSRDDISKKLSDYQPTHKGGLSGNALSAAKDIGVGGPSGADLVTAALPGGTGKYNNIMGQLRDKLRPMIRENADLVEIAKANGLSEDDVLDAFLGVPSALDKYNKALANPHHNTKTPTVDNPEANLDKLPGLDTLQRQAQAAGGSTLNAAIVGQALAGAASTGAGGAPGSAADLARRAANPDVGLPTGSIFGKGSASAGNGEYKVVTKMPPSDPNMAALIKAGAVKVEATVPGAVDSNGHPFRGFQYTFQSKEMAQKYLTNVPDYHTGGPTQGGLGNLLDDEFVIHDRERFPKGALEGINDGSIPLDDLPHLIGGGFAIPVDIPPPVPAPHPAPAPAAPAPAPAPAAMAPTDVGAGLGTAVPGGTGETPSVGAPLDVQGAPAPAMPAMAPVPTSLNSALFGGTPDLAGNPLAPTIPGNAAVPTIPGGGLNSLIFGAQGAPTGTGGGGGFSGGLLQSFLGGGGGGGGGQSIGGMFEQIAGKFGQIAMQGLLGFFGIDPQYLGDLAKLIPGLSKAFGGFSDPSAQASVEGLITGYAADGSPITYASGQPGTALPDPNGYGTGGGGPSPPNTTNAVGGSGTAPSGAVISANPLSKAGMLSGAPNVGTNLANAPAGMFTPLYKPGLNTNGYGNSTGLPDWATQLGAQFGLSPSTYNGQGTHGEGFAMDFSPIAGNKDPMGSMNRFSEFISQNLGSQTLQLIHWDPGDGSTGNRGFSGAGKHWGMAAAKTVDAPGGAFQDYYTKGDEGYGGHVDHVHWATDVPVVMGDANSTAMPGASNGLVNTVGGTPSDSPLPPSTTGATYQPANTNAQGANASPGPAPSAATPLPNTIQSNDNGPLPPAVISPPSSSGDGNLGGPDGGDDTTQVMALTKQHGALVVEPLNVAKANGDTVLGPAPKDGKIGNAASGTKTPGWGLGAAPPGTDNAGADIVIPDKGFMGGGGGTALPARIMGMTSAMARSNVTTPDQLKAFLSSTGDVNKMDAKQRYKSMYAAAGFPLSEWGDLDQLLTHESGWNPKAQNPGSTAHGMGQFLDTTWSTVGGMKTDDADTQFKYILKYLSQRPDYHGSPAAAWNLWQQRHWYDKGGVVDDIKGFGGIAASFLDDAGVMALNALARAKGGSSKLLGGAAKALGPFGMIAPELLDAISPQAHTSGSDTLDYTKALKHVPHAANGRHITEGRGYEDDVLAMLKRNEFVHTDKSVNMYGLDFHNALNRGMIDPTAVQALMGAPRFAAGGTLGANPPSPNDLQNIQAQLASSPAMSAAVTPTPPSGPQRSGVSVPDFAKMQAPTSTSLQPTTVLPPPQPGGPTAPPAPNPLEPEAGVPVQPNIAPAPSSTDHELPALKQGITAGAATLGSLAAAAAGASGFGAPAASLVSGAFNVGGKVVNDFANVISSALVGTLTPGTTANPYGQRVKGNAAPQTLMPVDNSTHYHGDLYANDMDDFMRRQDIRDSVNMQSQMAAVPGA